MIRSLFFTLFCSVLFGCTDFCIHDEDDNIVIGRSMEFSVPLHSEIVIHPKGERIEAGGISWTNRYSYMGVTAFVPNVITDGFNEAGLSFGALWFPTAEYPPVKDKEKALPIDALGDWILGNFSSVEEVKKALQKIALISLKIPKLEMAPLIHLSLYDREGNGLVVEFIDGKMELYDNVVGVLTNTPSYPWHVTNLANYIDLTPYNRGSINLEKTVIGPLGQGSGLLGIPGDWTPPSRFVRMTTFKHIVHQAKNPAENVLLAFHLLNTVDIPYGAVRSPDGLYNYTQWTVAKDLKNNILYYRTYESLQIKSIPLPKNPTKVEYFSMSTSADSEK